MTFIDVLSVLIGLGAVYLIHRWEKWRERKNR